MTAIIAILKDNPLLLFFLVAAVGFPLGKVRIFGASLGTASVLFVGIAVGALDPDLKLPPIVYLLGLTVFIYTIGLSSAAGFFRSFSRRGLRDLGLALATLAGAGFLGHLLGLIWHIPAPQASAMYSGAFTNASGLAQVVEAVKATGGDPAAPVVGYSLAYPIGILGPMLVMLLAKIVFRVNLQKEALAIPAYRRSMQGVETRTFRVTNPEAESLTVAELAQREGHEVVFGRRVRDGASVITPGDEAFRVGDIVVAVGPKDELDRVQACLGEVAPPDVFYDRSEFDLRRIFVSKPEVAGRALRDLELPQKEQVLITRIRRGDAEFIPNGDTVLLLGDRVRVLTRRENLERVSQFFGDSYRALSEVDLLTLCLGIALGVLIGLVPIPLPGGVTFKLGFAGGPLVAALVLGKLERTGPFVWNIPYSANLTLRQFGLLMFAAGIGTRAGYDFYDTLSHGKGLYVFLSGMIMTFGAGAFLMLIGHKFMRIPLNTLFGIYAGAQTQPVNLAFATDQTKNDLPQAGYANVFPMATIFKILIAQVLFEVMR